MTARERRLIADYKQICKDFSNHPNIIVTPIQGEPPEKYRVIYNGITGLYKDPQGRIMTQTRHAIEITLHAEYPHYKPICRILTPVFHPNFRESQICIGDIWGAGESLSNIIIDIGDMIQYKSWNALSPLSVEAATWAVQHSNLFPVSNVNLNVADASGNTGAKALNTEEITLF